MKHWERQGKTWKVIGEAFCFLAFQQADGFVHPAGGFLSVVNVCHNLVTVAELPGRSGNPREKL